MGSDERLKALDRQIDAYEADAVMNRWEFGRLLLRERRAHGNGKQLPNGRLDEVAEMIGKSRREVQYRVRFAEMYPTQRKVRSVLRTSPSWSDVLSLLTTRGAEVTAPASESPVPAPEAAAALEALVATRAADAARRREYAEDEQAHGPNTSSAPPLTSEAERLRSALRTMYGAALQIEIVAALPIPLPQSIAELNPANVQRQLTATRHAHDAVQVALARVQPIDIAEPVAQQELNVDGEMLTLTALVDD